MRCKYIAFGSLVGLLLSSSVSLAGEKASHLGSQDVLSEHLLQQAREAIKLREQQPFVAAYSEEPIGTYFHVRYKNDAGSGLNAGPLLEQSTITLDGKQYQYHGPAPISFHIQAEEDRSFLMSPDDYIPRVKRSVPADCLHRWRWVSGIAPGQHTLLFQFGGRQYGPVNYYWAGTESWNVPYAATASLL